MQICRASRGLVDITPKLLSSASWHSYLSLDLTLVAADIMGAGAVTAYAEEIAAELAKLTGRRALLRIVSNDAGGRIVGCQVGFLVDDVGGMQTAELIVAAAQYAAADERRAITHNKGIQNGLEAFALALGNDTRALSAGVHYYALRGGTCKPLSTWWLEGKILKGKATIPVALGSVGGATRRSVIRDICWRMLDCDSGTMAREICAAVGVAANLGALRALVTTGVGGKWS